MTLAELRALDFNFTGDREIGRAIIPTLEEVMLLAKGNIALNIEIKNCPYRYPGIEEEVVPPGARARHGGGRGHMRPSTTSHW